MSRKNNKRIYIWVDEKQKEKLKEKAKEVNQPLSHFLLTSAENSIIYKVEGLKEVAQELRKIGNNLNQLTHLAHIIKLKSQSHNQSRKASNIDFSHRLNETKEGLEQMWRSLNLLIEKTKNSKV